MENLSFYLELGRLLRQVPEDTYTSLSELALAMGDLACATSIRDALKRPEFSIFSSVVRDGANPFNSFHSNRLLRTRIR